MKLKWERNKRQYSNGIILYLGEWPVGEVFWNSTRSEPNKPYGVSCFLPGIKSRLGNFETEQAGKEKLEKTVKYWMEMTDFEKEKEFRK